MKNLILITLCLLPFLLKAQDCKFTQDEKDEFTNKELLQTKNIRLSEGLSTKMLLSLRKNGDSYFIEMILAPGSGVIAKGNELIFKLKDNTMVKALSYETKSSGITSTAGYTNSYFQNGYDINKSDLENLSKQFVQKIRLYTTNEYYDIDVYEKSAQKFMEAVICILSK